MADSSIEAMANLLHINDHVVDENAMSRASIPGDLKMLAKGVCPVNPCLHGGVCELDSLQPSGKRCRCISGYTGTLCQGSFFFIIILYLFYTQDIFIAIV